MLLTIKNVIVIFFFGRVFYRRFMIAEIVWRKTINYVWKSNFERRMQEIYLLGPSSRSLSESSLLSTICLKLCLFVHRSSWTLGSTPPTGSLRIPIERVVFRVSSQSVFESSSPDMRNWLKKTWMILIVLSGLTYRALTMSNQKQLFYSNIFFL